ncbi:MAG: thioredoxin family protein [Deltaproteobacteria bacterium]
MKDDYEDRVRAERAAVEDLQAQLKPRFKDLPHDVPLILLTSPGRNDVLTEATRFLIRVIREVAPRITLREYDLGHEAARSWEADRAPTLLFDPDRYRIRWLGAPVGEEARSFIEALLMMGHRKTDLGEQSLRVLKGIDSPRHIKLFVSPSCPYCPQQAVNALKAAIEKPDLISLEIIDIQANPDLADEYAAQSVPQAFANEILIAQGAQPEELFLLSLEKLEPQTVFIPESDAEEVDTDLVIIGGGPAGLTAGIYSARSGLRTVIIERASLGGQVATTGG